MWPSPPISCFSTLLDALVKGEHFSLAVSSYKTLEISGVLGLRSNFVVLNILLDCYSRMKLGGAAYSVLGLILKNGYRPNTITFNILLKGLCFEEKVVEAAGLFSGMIQFGCAPCVRTYTMMINCLCKTGNAATALHFHRDMAGGKQNTLSYALTYGRCIELPVCGTKEKDAIISPNVVYYTCLINGLCRSGMEEDARSLFVEMINCGIHPNVVTYNTLINLLCKKGKVDQGIEVMEIMISRGEIPCSITYNTMLDGYCRIGKIEEAMSCRGICVDNVTISTLLKGFFHVKKVDEALSLFDDMKKMDLKQGSLGACGPNLVTYTTMIDGLCKEGRVGEAQELFLEMQGNGICPDVVVYGCLIDGLCKIGHVDKAKEHFLEMRSSDVSPNVIVYKSLIDGLCKKGHVDKAKELFLEMKSSGISPNVFVYNTLIHGLFQFGNDEKAKTGYCKEGMHKEAHTLLLEMDANGCSPNVVSYNTLIDAYCKADMLEDAYNLLLEMEAKGCSADIITFKTLILGFARHKEFARVKDLVEKMHGKNISPEKDEYGQSWINSLPDFSSLNPSKDAHQISVIVADNYFTGSKDNLKRWIGHPRFELIRHDVTEPLLVEVDRIYHLACPASPIFYKHNPVKTIKTNVMGTLNMLGLAKRVGARILLTSTSEVYGDPLLHPQPETYWGNVNPIGVRSCYDEGKRVAETLMFDYHRQHGIEIRVARIFNTYGPRMNIDDGRVVSNFIAQALRFMKRLP